MSADRRRLLERLRVLEHASALRAPELECLEREVAASREVRARRAAASPQPSFPSELPISAERDRIAAAVERHQVVVVCGETGSGKTTQLPKICLSLGLGSSGWIGHTQPRRIAARAVCARLAEELESRPGQAVGYKVRFSDRVGPDCYVKLMTDGILLAEVQADPLLEHYDTLIIDEAHERSLNIDFLLGYLRHLLPRRPDLKLIITSATIDPHRFSQHFGDAPVLEVSGRSHPVEVCYRPLRGRDEDERDLDLAQAIVDAVDEACGRGPGDVLVFLSGEREIREMAERLRKHHPAGTEILPLYARLSADEQHRVFEPHGRRRIVLATNVAETSLTVPGIRFVVDPGYARISRYSHRSKVQRLRVEKISRASADQRKGRCGRIGPGVCFRLYSQEDYEARPPFTDPAILRTNLAAVILQMSVLGLGEIGRFPFLDPPDRRMVRDGVKVLEELGALGPDQRLSDVGRLLARLPVDPRVGRMLVAARDEDCLREMLVVAAALSIQDPRERPMEAREAADHAHRRFHNERSDFLAYLELWEFYEERRQHLSQSKLRELCRANFLSFVRMREWREVHQQLSEALLGIRGFRLSPEPAGYPALHRALLTGLLSHLAVRQEDLEYLGARGRRLQIFPGSGVSRRGGKWIVAAELVETARLYARTVARVDPQWVEQVGAHLLKRAHFDPHWDAKAGLAMIFERVTLFGLVIHAKRRVGLAAIDRQAAREMLLRRGLIAGELQSRGRFLDHNRSLIEEIQQIEDRVRRRDLFVGEEGLYRFYDARVPPEVCDVASFERWRRKAEQTDPRVLCLTREDVLAREALDVNAARFPSHFTVGGLVLDLDYRFEPGHPADGVTAIVPLAALNQLSAAPFEWLVPGLLEEKIVALLRSLPKSLRKSFVPIPEFATACAEALSPPEGLLLERLAARLRGMTGVSVPPQAWRPEILPDHLRMGFRVIAPDGAILAEGRDLSQLQAALGEQARESVSALARRDFDRERITEWDFGELPEQLPLARGGVTVPAFPALLDRGDCVALVLLDDPAHAEAATRPGVRRLLLLALSREARYLRRNLPHIEGICMRYATLARPDHSEGMASSPCEEIKEHLLLRTLDRVFLEERDLPRRREEFLALLEQGKGRLVTALGETASRVDQILRLHQAVQARLRAAPPPAAWRASAEDMREQLARLVYRGFVLDTPSRWLERIPVYLRAVELRLERIAGNPQRDALRMAQVRPLWRRALDGNGPANKDTEAGGTLRWMSEELRVSLFAQELGTAMPVSVQRLERAWEDLDRERARA